MPQAEPRQARLDIALDWLLRARQAPDDARLQAQLQDWRQAEPENAEALLKAERVWSMTGQLAPATAHKWPPIPPETAIPSPPVHIAARPRRRRGLSWAIGGALAACLVVAVAPGLNTALQADVQTASNERREIQLPDGSRAVLDSNSAIAFEFTDTRRDIRLLCGQAFFEVKPDRSKPFNVQAQDLNVTVTGTAFNVDLEAKSIEVGVQHGSVKVTERSSNRILSPGLTAGQQLDFNRSNGQTRMETIPTNRIATWRNGQLIADNARLADVVDELRRYLPATLWLKDPQLAEKRITGVYDTRNPEAALRAMAQPHGAKVEGWGPWLLVISR
ncbi:FecR family protein [Pseudomonas sp. NPDC089734]|uniref:FecR family protein n=1 Tax=Pseudomonas sp. NPDC089734 TaxID=3364469 RepID=UPI003821C491